MAGKAKTKSTNNNKNIIIGICVAVVVIAVVAVAIFFATRGPQLNDSYFVSDNTKYVVTVDDSASSSDGAPVKTHYVYTYSGDKITGATIYLEFTNEATAKTALDAVKEESEGVAKSVSVNGKYIVAEMTEDQYSDMTLSEIKAAFEESEDTDNM